MCDFKTYAAGWSFAESRRGFTTTHANQMLDAAGFNILAENFRQGATFAQGDFYGERTVDLRDFLDFRKVLNEAQGQAAVVPEPTALTLLSMTLPLLPLRRTGRGCLVLDD